jgi:hypothetical protein
VRCPGALSSTRAMTSSFQVATASRMATVVSTGSDSGSTSNGSPKAR